MPAPHWLTREQLMYVPFAASPLSLVGENVNHLYRYYSPALVNIALHGDAAGQQLFEFAMPVSDDGLVYRVEVHVWTSADTAVTVKLSGQSGASTGSWGSVLIADTEATSATGHRWVNSALQVGTLANGITHGRLDVSAASGNVQAHCVIIYPDAPLSLPSAKTTAGFTPYVADVLEDVAGAGIHRELVNRFAEDARVILRDRPHQILGYCDTTTASVAVNSGKAPHQSIFVGGAHIPGQAGCDATVRYRITDTTGSGSVCYLRDVGGANDITLTVDDTDRTATLSNLSERPQFAVLASPDSVLEIKYIQVDWTPGD